MNTESSHKPIYMPSAEELRLAAHILDLTICAAEDHGTLDQRSIGQLVIAHDQLDHLARYASRSWQRTSEDL